MNREEYIQKYISEPVLFNARYQAQGKYPGLDPLRLFSSFHCICQKQGFKNRIHI